jgi:RNA polymerase sigma-70 factor (ECF subfamily)
MDFIPGGELSRRIREGDVSAESELIRQFEPGLRVLLRRRTGGDLGLLQDLVQETLLVVIQRLRGEGIDEPAKLAAFAAQTARNLAIASLRKAERQKTDVDSEATERNADPTRSVEGLAEDAEAAMAVRALLRELPQSRDRLMLKRFYLDDHDKEVICQEMQLSEAAFNQALSRARRRFKQILEERGFSRRDLLNPEP